MDIFEQYATDETKEVEGTWVDDGDAELLIARAGNRRYTKKLLKLYDRHKKALDRKDDAADALSDNILIEVLSETILLGWKNITLKGEPLPYTPENAQKLLAIKDFRKRVMDLSDDFDAYKVKEEADQAKN